MMMQPLPRSPDGAATVLRRPELLDRGFTDADIHRALRDGTLIRVERGCYLTGDAAPVRPAERYRARVLARAGKSSRTIVSHLSGLAVHGVAIDGADLSRVHTVREGETGGLWEPGYVRHAGGVEPADQVAVGGVRVTSVARTLVDVGRTESFRTTVVAADDALHRELVTPAELAAALDTARRRTGIGAARRALRFADGRSESVGESRLRIRMWELNLPTPELQVEIVDAAGRVLARADGGYPELGLLLEFDGLEKYLRPYRPGESTADVVVREKLREDRLRELGCTVVRFVYADLDRDLLIRHRLEEGARSARRQLAAGAVTATLRPRPAIRIE